MTSGSRAKQVCALERRSKRREARLQDLWVHARPGPVVLEDGVRHLHRDAAGLGEEQVRGQPRNHQAPCRAATTLSSATSCRMQWQRWNIPGMARREDRRATMQRPGTWQATAPVHPS